jgi:hypothetical protein
MVRRNALFEVEQIEKLALIACLTAHHDPPPSLNESSESESWFAVNHEPFSTASTHFRHQWPKNSATQRDLGTPFRWLRFPALMAGVASRWDRQCDGAISLR